jgi:hypothetical protein
MAVIGYVSVEARDAQTKHWVRLIGAILPRSNFYCFLAGDVTRPEKSSQIAAARGLLMAKRSHWLYFIAGAWPVRAIVVAGGGPQVPAS